MSLGISLATYRENRIEKRKQTHITHTHTHTHEKCITHELATLSSTQTSNNLQIRVVAGADAVLVVIDALKIKRLLHQFFILFIYFYFYFIFS